MSLSGSLPSFVDMDIRIIPRLDIKGPNLVKGIHLEGLRVLGKPETFARHYYEMGADELIYQDAVASLYNRNSLHEIISRTAQEVFIPLTVGGGLRCLDDIREVLRSGADKVSLNTAALKDPLLIRQASEKFGSSTIVVAIEAIKQPDGRYLAYTDNGREYTGVEVLSWAKRVEDLGAGEIFLTSVDREGTGMGFDVDLVRSVADALSIPVIAHGGAGNKEHLLEVIRDGHANAVALSSVLHYDFIRTNRFHEKDFVGEGNVTFLKSDKSSSSRIVSSGLKEIKDYLTKGGIPCRYESECGECNG
jgi:cyclase